MSEIKSATYPRMPRRKGGARALIEGGKRKSSRPPKKNSVAPADVPIREQTLVLYPPHNPQAIVALKLRPPDAEKDLEECAITGEPFSNKFPMVPYAPCGMPVLRLHPDLNVGELPCGHSFHAAAVLVHFLYRNLTCPLCRAGPAGQPAEVCLPPNEPWFQSTLHAITMQRIEDAHDDARTNETAARALEALMMEDIRNMPSPTRYTRRAPAPLLDVLDRRVTSIDNIPRLMLLFEFSMEIAVFIYLHDPSGSSEGAFATAYSAPLTLDTRYPWGRRLCFGLSFAQRMELTRSLRQMNAESLGVEIYLRNDRTRFRGPPLMTVARQLVNVARGATVERLVSATGSEVNLIIEPPLFVSRLEYWVSETTGAEIASRIIYT